jgi:hypothetical protein
MCLRKADVRSAGGRLLALDQVLPHDVEAREERAVLLTIA